MLVISMAIANGMSAAKSNLTFLGYSVSNIHVLVQGCSISTGDTAVFH